MSTALMTRQPAPQRQGGVWSYVSPSRLGLWIRCPLAFKFRYIDGIRSPTNANMFIGKMCHSGLETFYRHRQLGITLSAEDVAKRMVDGWDATVAEENTLAARRCRRPSGPARDCHRTAIHGQG